MVATVLPLVALLVVQHGSHGIITGSAGGTGSAAGSSGTTTGSTDGSASW